MKTQLPKRSLVIKKRLDAIVEEILAVGKNELAMIILFGSYARGTWVIDTHMEGHTTHSYVSDIDIMLVTKNPNYAGFQGGLLEGKIEDRLERRGLNDMLRLTPQVTLITETIGRFNKELEKSQYFFSDIKEEGILLYDSGKFKLAEPKELSWEERKEIAQDYYDQWFPDGCVFLNDSINTAQRGNLRHGAFYLHQATESFYNAILLVFSGYKSRNRSHDIKKLGSLASNYSDELLKIFPRDTEEQKHCFKLLREAYIKARYDKTYKITAEELLYLVQRVEKLKTVTEEICQTWINQGIEPIQHNQ